MSAQKGNRSRTLGGLGRLRGKLVLQGNTARPSRVAETGGVWSGAHEPEETQIAYGCTEFGDQVSTATVQDVADQMPSEVVIWDGYDPVI